MYAIFCEYNAGKCFYRGEGNGDAFAVISQLYKLTCFRPNFTCSKSLQYIQIFILHWQSMELILSAPKMPQQYEKVFDVKAQKNRQLYWF
jgi:hypothetical protein